MADLLNHQRVPAWLHAALGAELAICVVERVNPRARRISLRVDAAAGHIVLVRPKRAGDTLVARFVAEKKDWIVQHAANLTELPNVAPLNDGMALRILDETLTLRHVPEGRGGVWREGDAIYVTGRVEHMTRRVRDWLKVEARQMLGAMAQSMATDLGRPLQRVSVRDPRSRWGSCNAKGEISLSWRLMLAPRTVARYVVAHEVAHLKHLDHSPAFWRTVAALCPDHDAPRAWLRQNGAALHRIVAA